MEQECFGSDISTVEHTSEELLPQTTSHRSRRTPFVNPPSRINLSYLIVSCLTSVDLLPSCGEVWCLARSLGAEAIHKPIVVTMASCY
jgi:hypothetical protein